MTTKYGLFLGWHTDADGKRWGRFHPGTIALTAAAAEQAEIDRLHAAVDAPPRMSRATLEALDRARQRMQAEEQRRLQFETCGDPSCSDCATTWATLA